ncbi:MAG: hypothetical protein WCG27_07635 [Pseudomonadota bacterium]
MKVFILSSLIILTCFTSAFARDRVYRLQPYDLQLVQALAQKALDPVTNKSTEIGTIFASLFKSPKYAVTQATVTVFNGPVGVGHTQYRIAVQNCMNYPSTIGCLGGSELIIDKFTPVVAPEYYKENYSVKVGTLR